ncbi:MAG: inorganic diphosphatase [Balneolaceae bacterium]|nr:MAG: inorganic diphosphatase [Balneolaceae bacterium]
MTNTIKINYLIFCLLFILFQSSACSSGENDVSSTDQTDFLRDIDPVSDQGYVNIVIEIPAGDNEKWEVDKITGNLLWEEVGDSLRIINYLPYPANYGMVPRTLLPKEKGGDDDPIDIFLLGPVRERGTVAEGIIIGALGMLDRGEQDDKLIAVDPDSWFGSIRTISELDEKFPGVLEILSIWMENYKGKGIVELTGILNSYEANELFEQAVESYHVTETDDNF